MANDSKGESPAAETGVVKEVEKAENKVINGAKAPPVQAETTVGENVKSDAGRTRTYVISAEEMEEFKMMKAVLATRQGKALFLDYLEGDIGRYVDMTEEGRRVDGEPEDVWQDY